MRRSIRFLATTRVLVPLSIVLGFAMLTGASVLKVMPAVASTNQQQDPGVAARRLDRLTPEQALSVTAPATAGAATVQTDRLDYYPGENVIITGAGWQAGEVVQLVLHEEPPLDPDLTLYAGADADGYILNSEFYTDWHDNGVAFTLTATGLNSQLTAQTTFTDSAANLDQWANLPTGSWVNGNLGASKSTYFEGNSIPYRITMSGLPLNTHTITIEWATTKSGKHALDYLTSFLQPNPISGDQPNPCLGVSGCDPLVFTTFPIPADPQVTGAGVTPIPGNFTMYGGTITAASSYSYPGGPGFGGDKTARITITFTADVANPVLAWGGHISTRLDWGANNSAVAIPGSPYHTNLVDLDGSGGNQDRSLSADAVIFPGQITIVKSADPTGDTIFNFTNSPALPLGGSSVTSFTLKDDGTTANNTKVFKPVVSFSPPNYTVTETVPSDWKLDHITCTVDQDPVGGSSASGSGSTATITLKEGAFVTCTFFDIGTRLTVNKTVVPSTDTGLFNLQIDGTTAGKGANVGDGGTTGVVAVTAGAHAVGETAGTGTTLSDYTKSFSGDCDSTGNVTLAAGDSKTCTITNTRKPKLIVIKHVINDNGGSKVAADFPITVTGSSPSPASFAGAESPGTSVNLNPGSYSVSETTDPNYAATYSADCSGTIAAGETKTCTITNDDKAAHLIIIKSVVNDNGGTKVAGDFSGTITGVTASGGNTWTGTVSPGVDKTLTSVGSYNVTETADSGYTTTYSTDCTGSIALGQTKTCTVTNDDKPAHLIIIKSVTNDNGGTKVAGDFSGTITGVTASGGNTWTGTVAPGVDKTLTTVGAYGVTETADPDYTTTYSADCNGTIALGQTKTCTVTNDDKPAHLIIIKSVTNDNGGTKVAGDFSGTITGVTASGGNAWTGTVAPGVDKTLTTIGAYGVSETADAAYTTTYSTDCSGTIALGQTKTCTVTNNDKPAHLKLVKTVTNDNGGTAAAADFTLSAAGPTPISGAGGAESDVSAGTYTLSETNLAGYTAGSWSCVGGSQSNGSVKLAVGQSATCTINNNDQLAQLTVIKHVVNDNGGSATAGQWTMNVTASNPSSASFAGTEVGTMITLDAGSFSVAESGGATGYSQTGAVGCSGTIAVGESKTCTITNDDISPTLTVTKICDPTTDTGLFNLRIDGTTYRTDATCTGLTNTTGAVGVGVGGHIVSETQGTDTQLSDYVSVIGGDCDSSGNVTLALAQNKTCTITNTKKGTGEVIKTVNGAAPSGDQAFTFQLRQGASTTQTGTTLETQVANAANGGDIPFTTKLVPGDTYQMCEIVMPGWLTSLGTFVPNSFIPPDGVAPNPTVDNSILCGNFTVTPGGTETFTIDNTPPPGGRALTIGFWKNWASCAGSNGGQDPVLDETLDLFPIAPGQTKHGVFIGDIYVDTCQEAVRLLNKSDVLTNKKMASDPAYNLAAQLMAARLNVQAGAGVSPCAVNAINAAQTLLDTINFTGTGKPSMTKAQITQANNLATTLDKYNNNTLVCP